jgi:hypothetical protein
MLKYIMGKFTLVLDSLVFSCLSVHHPGAHRIVQLHCEFLIDDPMQGSDL